MSTDHINLAHENENSGSKSRFRAIVWDYFEKITGDDGLQKTRCTKCKKVYSCAPNSGTSTMRRHLRKCWAQPLTQVNPLTSTARSSDELAHEARAAKKLKSVMEDNLQSKTDRELLEFIWMNKRNIGLLEEKLPDKAITIKDALKCYESEIDRRAKPQHPKKNNRSPGTSIVAVKIETDDQMVAQYENLGHNMAEDVSVVEGGTTELHADVDQKSSQQFDNGKVVIKVKVDDQSVAGNQNFDRNMTDEERAGRLQIVAINGDQNQAYAQQTAISIIPEDICAELKKVSSVLSLLTSPDSYYTPRGNPLDEEAENAKQSLVELLNKDFDTIVGSPDAQKLKYCVQILTNNLDKLPRFQGRVIETLNSGFESACQNWTTWRKNIHTNIACEVKQEKNLEVLQEWQEKDVELELKIAEVDADILRLKAELHEKELTRENLVKQKSDLFDQSKISIDEAKKLLQEMVTAKLQSDVAIDNMKDVATKWEKIRESFQAV